MEGKERKLIHLDDKKISKRMKKVIGFLQEEIIGQDGAVEALVEALENYSSPARNRSRPVFSVLFLGPTGVGKIRVPEMLAKLLFGDPQAFTRITCSNLSDSSEIDSDIDDEAQAQEIEQLASYPALSQWNLDRHHHKYLAREHKEEIGRTIKRCQELLNVKQKAKEIGEEIRSLSDEIKNKETAMKELVLERQENFDDEAQKIDDEITNLQAEAALLEGKRKKMADELISFNKELSELDGVFKRLEEMCRFGWVYEPSNPPKNLTSIVVFDKIENSHPVLLNILLEIMETGQLQISEKQTTSFKNSFIIIIGKVIAEEIAEMSKHMGFQADSSHEVDSRKRDDVIRNSIIEKFREKLPSELTNRVNKIVIFQPLEPQHLIRIFKLLIRNLNDDLAKSKLPFGLKVDQEAMNHLVDLSVKKSEFGAQALEDCLEKFIRTKIARMVESDEIKLADTVVVKLEEVNGEKQIKFYKKDLDDQTLST
ncbi:MAG: AAA family ATPase [Candidatus Harrisonbacteria bacterium]|nr:AAA family ATPase [Candidatus Harrisonbacteria bacterium]